MSENRKKQGGSNFLYGLIGLGVGALGGFLIKTLLDDDKQEKIKQSVNVNQTNNSNNIKITNQPKQQLTRSDEQFQQMMHCPIGLQIMNQPMTIAHCGHTFQKKTIYSYLSNNKKCPICRKQATIQNLVPNYQLKNVIDHYKQTKK